MVDFYRVRSPEQSPGTAVVVAEDTNADILLRWVPNTGLWHRATELENDYLFGDEGGTYEPISADEAARLIGQVAPFDERRAAAQRILARYRAQPPAEQRANAEMGLSQVQTRMKPMSAPGLGELLRRSARTNRWRTLARYPEGAGSAPRQLVSDWSRRSRPLGLDGLELRIVGDQAIPVVQARAVRKTPTGTPTKSMTKGTGSCRREQAVIAYGENTDYQREKGEPEMKVRLRTRQQLAAELARAARPENPDSPTSRVRTARELLGDGMWAQSHYSTPEVDPQRVADAWVAAEKKWMQTVVAIGSGVLRLPRRQPRPIKITD